ncbi:MAG: helix-turn-helix transcriptional regulator [Clostridia bacterium]|nr:helix-turn-helix transcriptional regulator [Clostridia bacterium]
MHPHSPQLQISFLHTQQYVANILNIKQNTYSQYESGQRQLSLEQLIKLSEFYSVSTDYILGIKDI